MPEAAAVNDLYQVRLIGRIEGQETNNVLHFQCVGATTDVELNLIQVFLECFITNLLPVLSSNWQLVECRWKKVYPTLGVETVTVPSGTTTGGGSASSLPSFNSLLYSIRTPTGGRTHRGRMYVAGIPEDATLGSAFDPTHAFWTGALAFALCVVSEFVHPDPAGGSDLFNLVVYSRKLGGSIFPYGLAGVTSMQSFTPNLQIASTRSRKVGRGS